MIWKQQFTLEALNEMCKGTVAEVIGMKFIAFGDDWIEAKIPVDSRTYQPAGLLHGGVSCVLAETLGSTASALCIEDFTKETCVGTEINASHLRGVKDGFVIGRCRPIRVGRSMHVWEINIRDEREKLVCTSRLSVAIVLLKH
jgi:1,4-dihydroxy-2-naphthoyl-CoA hydrolase